MLPSVRFHAVALFLILLVLTLSVIDPEGEDESSKAALKGYRIQIQVPHISQQSPTNISSRDRDNQGNDDSDVVIMADGTDASHGDDEGKKKTVHPRIYVYPDNLNPSGNVPSREYMELEVRLLDAMRIRGRIVEDPEDATHFWIPHALVANWIPPGSNVAQWPHKIEKYLRDVLHPFMDRMVYEYPYYNRTGGSDHVFLYVMDRGPFCDAGIGSSLLTKDPFWHNILRPMRKVGYYGQRNHVHSKTNMSCWYDDTDIALPQWHTWNMTENVNLTRSAMECSPDQALSSSCDIWTNHLVTRANRTKASFFFRGQVIKGGFCSKYVRHWVEKFCKHHTECIWGYDGVMEDAVFALAPAGWACWSSRMYDAFYRLSVPVIMADNMVLPFERQLNWSYMSEQVITGEPTDLPSDGGIQIQRLHNLAQSWTETCRNVTYSNSGSTNDTTLQQQQRQACLEHPVSQKMQAMVQYRRYFGWDIMGDENAFALFERELVNDTSSFPSLVFSSSLTRRN